jgi:hypothetical protein
LSVSQPDFAKSSAFLVAALMRLMKVRRRQRACERPLPVLQTPSEFFGTHNETLSVAMRVHDPDCSPFKIER